MGAALIFRQLLIDPASYAKNVRPCLSVVNRIYRLDINICPFFLFRVPETQLKSIVWQTLQAVNFCHKHNVSMSSLSVPVCVTYECKSHTIEEPHFENETTNNTKIIIGISLLNFHDLQQALSLY